jgi:RNA polymerase sigma-70 factor, ECF subfamily
MTANPLSQHAERPIDSAMAACDIKLYIMKTGPLDDEELIACYRAGGDSPYGREQLDELFRRYHVRVAAWCLRLTGNREVAADLAQEVFLKAYRNLESFRGDAKFSTWIYSIARNHCFNYIKSRSRQPVEVGDEPLVDATAGVQDVLDALEKADSERRALQLMEEVLDEVEKKVMTLHYAEEMPLDSVTRFLSLTNPSGAKAYIVSAKRKLKRALQRSEAGMESRGTEI